MGIDWDRVKRTEKRYKMKIEVLTRECEEVEEYIEEIPDRRIVDYG